jgi:hypothetical protein
MGRFQLFVEFARLRIGGPDTIILAACELVPGQRKKTWLGRVSGSREQMGERGRALPSPVLFIFAQNGTITSITADGYFLTTHVLHT